MYVYMCEKKRSNIFAITFCNKIEIMRNEIITGIHCIQSLPFFYSVSRSRYRSFMILWFRKLINTINRFG